jgi:hypothetical protein
MNLNAQPLDVKIELLLQLFDDALADIAEGSDIVGKDANGDCHGSSFLFIIADTATSCEDRGSRFQG